MAPVSAHTCISRSGALPVRAGGAISRRAVARRIVFFGRLQEGRATYVRRRCVADAQHLRRKARPAPRLRTKSSASAKVLRGGREGRKGFGQHGSGNSAAYGREGQPVRKALVPVTRVLLQSRKRRIFGTGADENGTQKGRISTFQLSTLFQSAPPKQVRARPKASDRNDHLFRGVAERPGGDWSGHRDARPEAGRFARRQRGRFVVRVKHVRLHRLPAAQRLREDGHQ